MASFGFVIAGFLMNFNVPRSWKGYAIPLVLSWVAIFWEFLELVAKLPTGQWDTLIDMTAFGLGGLAAVYLANRVID